MGILLNTFIVNCKIILEKKIRKNTSKMELPCKTSENFEWIDSHTFRITSIASPNEKTVGVKRRKQQASVNTLYCLQKKIRTEFIKILGKDIFAQKEDSFVSGKSIHSYYKNFRIIESSYDENQNCKQIVEIRYLNLYKILNSQPFVSQ